MSNLLEFLILQSHGLHNTMSVTDKQHIILTNVSNPQPAVRERINVV